MTTYDALPTEYSALIRRALTDLEACENDSRYTIDMGAAWHVWNGNGFWVCLVGAVAAKSLGYESRDPIGGIWAFPQQYQSRLSFLEKVQHRGTGALSAETEDSLPEEYQDLRVTRYSENPGQFKADLARIAEGLEKVGL